MPVIFFCSVLYEVHADFKLDSGQLAALQPLHDATDLLNFADYPAMACPTRSYQFHLMAATGKYFVQ